MGVFKIIKASFAGLKHAVVCSAAVIGFGIGAAQAEESYLNEVILMASNYCPRGSVPADGQLLQISENSAVFSLMGTTFGGDSINTFGVPLLNAERRNDPRPFVGAGDPIWCMHVWATYPGRDTGTRNDTHHTGHLMPIVTNFCPTGYSRRADTGLPRNADRFGFNNPDKVFWCEAQPVSQLVQDGWEYYVGELFLIQSPSCPEGSRAANGDVLEVTREHHVIYSVIGNRYGGTLPSTFALPNMPAPVPGALWCFVTDGEYPSRP